MSGSGARLNFQLQDELSFAAAPSIVHQTSEFHESRSESFGHTRPGGAVGLGGRLPASAVDATSAPRGGTGSSPLVQPGSRPCASPQPGVLAYTAPAYTHGHGVGQVDAAIVQHQSPGALSTANHQSLLDARLPDGGLGRSNELRVGRNGSGGPFDVPMAVNAGLDEVHAPSVDTDLALSLVNESRNSFEMKTAGKRPLSENHLVALIDQNTLPASFTHSSSHVSQPSANTTTYQQQSTVHMHEETTRGRQQQLYKPISEPLSVQTSYHSTTMRSPKSTVSPQQFNPAAFVRELEKEVALSPRKRSPHTAQRNDGGSGGLLPSAINHYSALSSSTVRPLSMPTSAVSSYAPPVPPPPQSMQYQQRQMSPAVQQRAFSPGRLVSDPGYYSPGGNKPEEALLRQEYEHTVGKGGAPPPPPPPPPPLQQPMMAAQPRQPTVQHQMVPSQTRSHVAGITSGAPPQAQTQPGLLSQAINHYEAVHDDVSPTALAARGFGRAPTPPGHHRAAAESPRIGASTTTTNQYEAVFHEKYFQQKMSPGSAGSYTAPPPPPPPAVSSSVGKGGLLPSAIHHYDATFGGMGQHREATSSRPVESSYQPVRLPERDDVDALINRMITNMQTGDGAAGEYNCSKCGEGIGGGRPGCTALGHTFHLSCFVCDSCSSALGGGSFFAVDGKPLCEQCHMKMLEKCCKCDKPITDKILRASGQAYHIQCFTCHVCQTSLDGTAFTVDSNNHNYCVRCFHEKYAPRCAICRQPIVPQEGSEDSVRVVAMDKSFHVDCYKCEDCGRKLSSKIEGGGCYPLDEHLYCKGCNAERVRSLTSAQS